MKKILTLIAAGTSAMLMLSGCADTFLKEELVSTITQDYLDTEQGLEQMIVANYNAFRFDRQFFAGHFTHEGGHDMMTTYFENDSYSGNTWDGNNTGWLTAAGAANGFLGEYSGGSTIGAYPEIATCNRAIKAIRSGAALGRFAEDPVYANQRLSESLVCRAWIYYELNTAFGDVHFCTEPYQSLPKSYVFERTPSADMYKTLISDLRFAYEHLPESYPAAEFGRATKYTAAFLLARMYLNRAQGKDWGTPEYGRRADGTLDTSNPKSYLGALYKGSGTADLDSAIFFAKTVIEKHPLDADYADIFPSGELGDYANETTPEHVHNAVFGKGTDNYRYSQRLIRFGAAEYTSELKGIPSIVWQYGAGRYTNFRATFVPTDDCFDLFDKINDSRFQKSFDIQYTTAATPTSKSVPEENKPYYDYKDPKNGTYKWSAAQAEYFNAKVKDGYKWPAWGGRSAVAGEHKMGAGDISQAFIENTKATAIDMQEALAQPYVIYARWIKDGDKYYYRAPVMPDANGVMMYNTANFLQLENDSAEGIPTTRKYQDSERGGTDSEYSYRDVNVMRTAEMYLVCAEAYGRKGDYNTALEYINALRYRAAFKDGEHRLDVIARLYPGHEQLSAEEQVYPYPAKNSYEKIKVDPSYWDGVSEHSKKENYHPQATTELARFIEFICNEYAREFSHEYTYYNEVHHAGVQAARIQWHKQAGANSGNSDYKAGSWDVADNVIGNSGQTGHPKGNFQSFNTLRPFPATYLNLLTDEDGHPLSNEAKAEYQNYGYNY